MPSRRESADKPVIMVVGTGDLVGRLLPMLLTDPRTDRLVLAGRDPETTRRNANLALFTAHNLGATGSVETRRLDLADVAACAETLADVRPDIVFMGASRQSWRRITELPPAVFAELDQAQFGPWLPMHLTLNHRLMLAVAQSEVETLVVNAAFPDSIGPVLAKVGLAPAMGIGNVANIIPALTFAVGRHLGADPAGLRVRLVAHHYVSHYVPRFGHADPNLYRLHVQTHDGQPVSGVDVEAVLPMLTGPLKRLGGVDGQTLTASSAMRVLRALAADSGDWAHAPAPDGLPGGYPVRVDARGATVDLPPGLSLAEAVAVNEAGQRADGIESVDHEGTVTFAEPEMAVMERMLGYQCRAMKLAECGEWAEELGRKYDEFAARHGSAR